MAPLSALEVEDTRARRERLWLCGGFPDSFLADSDADSLALHRDFLRTYLERNVAAFDVAAFDVAAIGVCALAMVLRASGG